MMIHAVVAGGIAAVLGLGAVASPAVAQAPLVGDVTSAQAVGFTSVATHQAASAGRSMVIQDHRHDVETGKGFHSSGMVGASLDRAVWNGYTFDGEYRDASAESLGLRFDPGGPGRKIWNLSGSLSQPGHYRFSISVARPNPGSNARTQLTVDVYVTEAVRITAQPVDVTVPSGRSATFTVQVNDREGQSVQWYTARSNYAGVDSWAWKPVPGSAGFWTLTTGPQEAEFFGVNHYRAVITSSDGKTLTSNAAAARVTLAPAAAPVITGQSRAS